MEMTLPSDLFYFVFFVLIGIACDTKRQHVKMRPAENQLVDIHLKGSIAL